MRIPAREGRWHNKKILAMETLVLMVAVLKSHFMWCGNLCTAKKCGYFYQPTMTLAFLFLPRLHLEIREEPLIRHENHSTL